MKISKKSSAFIRLKPCTSLVVLCLLACGSNEKDNSGSNGGHDSGATNGSANWTMLGYDLGSTYYNKAETKISRESVKNLTKAWEYDTTSPNVTATPVLANGKAYVLSGGAADGSVVGVLAIDLATGMKAWNSPIGTGSASLALSDGVLYAHTSDGVLHAVSATDGQEIWKLLTDDQAQLFAFSSPIVTKDYILVGGSTLEEVTGQGQTFRGFVEAVKKDGTLGWKAYTVDETAHGATLWSTVAVDETAGLVIAATGNNHGPPATDTSDAFLAFPLQDGASMTWKAQIFQNDTYPSGGPDDDFGANPVLFDLNGQKLAAGGSKGGDFWVLDRTTGTVIKQRNLGPGSAFKGGIFVAAAWDGTNLLTAVNGATSTGPGSETPSPGTEATLFALDPLTLDIKWEREVAGPVFGPISVANGVGFFGKNSVLQAFNTDTGEVLYEFQTEGANGMAPGTIASAPAISNGYVVFGSGMGWIGAAGGSKYYALKVP